MKLRTFLLTSAVLVGLGLFQTVTPAHAESTISCPSGEYDMLDWMTMDSDLRSSKYLGGSANPLYTDMWAGKFYWTKSGTGYPWDIQLYDNNNIAIPAATKSPNMTPTCPSLPGVQRQGSPAQLSK